MEIECRHQWPMTKSFQHNGSLTQSLRHWSSGSLNLVNVSGFWEAGCSEGDRKDPCLHPSPHHTLCISFSWLFLEHIEYIISFIINYNLRESALLNTKLFQQIVKPRFRGNLRHPLICSWLGRGLGGLGYHSSVADISSRYSLVGLRL